MRGVTVSAIRHSRRRKVRGVTMIEALVALFIMSIGLLGVAGLQATSIAAGHASALRSLAVFHSAEIAERIRANRTAVGSYAGTGAVHGCTGAKLCSDIEMAEEDLMMWKDSLSVSFANMQPLGTIVVDTTINPATVIVTIKWQERGQDLDYQVNLRI